MKKKKQVKNCLQNEHVIKKNKENLKIVLSISTKKRICLRKQYHSVSYSNYMKKHYFDYSLHLQSSYDYSIILTMHKRGLFGLSIMVM